MIAADLTDPEAPARVRDVVTAEHGELHLLVNNAGASWRGRFGDAGWANVERHMELDFEAPVRLTEALLPLLRATAGGAPASIVNVASTAGRVARPGAGAYSAAKFALVGWTDALHLEEREHGVHVGLVLPGFVRTEGFPATELLARAATRWIVSSPTRWPRRSSRPDRAGVPSATCRASTGSSPRCGSSPRGSSGGPPGAVRSPPPPARRLSYRTVVCG